MFNREDHTYQEMIKASTLEWLKGQAMSEDVVNKHGAKLASEYIDMLHGKIKELESKNQLKDEFLKKLKAQREANKE